MITYFLQYTGVDDHVSSLTKAAFNGTVPIKKTNLGGQSMKLFFSICIALCLVTSAGAGVYDALNPTKLWELRDSLQAIPRDNPHFSLCQDLLSQIDELNTYMSKVKDIVPFPNLRIDIIEAACPAKAMEIDAIRRRLEKQEFQRIATDCRGIRTVTQYADSNERCEIISASHHGLRKFIVSLSGDSNPRMQRLRELAKMVQCEYALITLGYALKQFRNLYGDPNKTVAGLLIVDDYFVESHLKTLLLIVRARSNLD